MHLDDENEGKEGEQKIEDVLTIHAQFQLEKQQASEKAAADAQNKARGGQQDSSGDMEGRAFNPDIKSEQDRRAREEQEF